MTVVGQSDGRLLLHSGPGRAIATAGPGCARLGIRFCQTCLYSDVLPH